MSKKHNYFYKITNLLNGKYYYGIRSCDKLPDNRYMGSGKVIKDAIKKYGVDNFTKEIIANYPTRKEASDHEAMIVTLELIELEECYNLKIGGDNGTIQSIEVRRKIGEKSKGRIWSEETKQNKRDWATGRKHTNETKQHIREIRMGEGNGFLGRTHTIEVRNKISQAQKGGNNVNAVKIFHLESGLWFDTKSEAKKYFKVSQYILDKQIKQGIFKEQR